MCPAPQDVRPDAGAGWLALESAIKRFVNAWRQGPRPVIDDYLPADDSLRRPLLIVWDRLPAHRSRLVGEFLDSLDGLIAVEYLPPYAPELNPDEYLWGYWKHHVLPNVCPKDLWELNHRARQTLRRMRRRPCLITAFWKQSSLAF